ncbi:MAG: hypothetical protein Q4C95_09810 [Planctomycetia bacterium]|nr:hypothetical protein [Planctomycetia bacterium]
MPRLTIIIPYLKSDSSERLEETLASVLENRSESTDVCVINAGQYYDPYNIEAEGVRFLEAHAQNSLLDCINLGLHESQSDFIHPILCGAIVKNDWTLKPLKRLENPDIFAVIPLVIEMEEENDLSEQSQIMNAVQHSVHKTVHAGYVYRRNGSVFPLKRNTTIQRWDCIAPHIGGAFFRRSSLEELGGFQTTVSPQIAYIDTSLLFSSLKERTVWEVNSILYYPQGYFASEQKKDALQWITEQEQLYSRWHDLGERLGTGFSHQMRIWNELLHGLFQGNFFKILTAFRNGKVSGALAQKQSLIRQIKSTRSNSSLSSQSSFANDSLMRPKSISEFPRETSKNELF